MCVYVSVMLVVTVTSIVLWVWCSIRSLKSVVSLSTLLVVLTQHMEGREKVTEVFCLVLAWEMRLISPHLLCFQPVHLPTGVRTASTPATATMEPFAAPMMGNANALLAGRGSTVPRVSKGPAGVHQGEPTHGGNSLPVCVCHVTSVRAPLMCLSPLNNYLSPSV